MANRKKNFSVDEVRVLREKFANNKTYLQSSFNNKVTNEGKNFFIYDIANKFNRPHTEDLSHKTGT